jgi:hypothetical protein
MESKIELELNSNSDLVDSNRQQSRFKVVKLLSTKPYSRGKWNCLDSNSDKDSNSDFNYVFIHSFNYLFIYYLNNNYFLDQ